MGCMSGGEPHHSSVVLADRFLPGSLNFQTYPLTLTCEDPAPRLVVREWNHSTKGRRPIY